MTAFGIPWWKRQHPLQKYTKSNHVFPGQREGRNIATTSKLTHHLHIGWGSTGKLITVTERGIADIFSYYKSDMGISEHEFKTEFTRWKHKWSGIDPNEMLETLVDTHAKSQFYPSVYVALVTLITYPVSTCTAKRSFSSMKRLKSPLTDERLSSLTILHIHKHKKADIDSVVTEFAWLMGRHLTLCSWPVSVAVVFFFITL